MRARSRVMTSRARRRSTHRYPLVGSRSLVPRRLARSLSRARLSRSPRPSRRKNARGNARSRLSSLGRVWGERCRVMTRQCVSERRAPIQHHAKTLYGYGESPYTRDEGERRRVMTRQFVNASPRDDARARAHTKPRVIAIKKSIPQSIERHREASGWMGSCDLRFAWVMTRRRVPS